MYRAARWWDDEADASPRADVEGEEPPQSQLLDERVRHASALVDCVGKFVAGHAQPPAPPPVAAAAAATAHPAASERTDAVALTLVEAHARAPPASPDQRGARPGENEEAANAIVVPDYYSGGWESAGISFEWFARVVLDAYLTAALDRVLSQRPTRSVMFGGGKLTPAEEAAVEGRFSAFVVALMRHSMAQKAPDDAITVVQLATLQRSAALPDVKLELARLAIDVIDVSLKRGSTRHGGSNADADAASEMSGTALEGRAARAALAFRRVLAIAPSVITDAAATDRLVDGVLAHADAAVELLRALKGRPSNMPASAATVSLERALARITAELFIPAALGAEGRATHHQRLRGCCAMLLGVFPLQQAVAALRRVASQLAERAELPTQGSRQAALVDVLARGEPAPSDAVATFFGNPVSFFLALFAKIGEAHAAPLECTWRIAPSTVAQREGGVLDKGALTPVELHFSDGLTLLEAVGTAIPDLGASEGGGATPVQLLLQECAAVALALHASQHMNPAPIFMLMYAGRRSQATVPSSQLLTSLFFRDASGVVEDVTAYVLACIRDLRAWRLLPYFTPVLAWLGDPCSSMRDPVADLPLMYRRQRNWGAAFALTQQTLPFFARVGNAAASFSPSMFAFTCPAEAKRFINDELLLGDREAIFLDVLSKAGAVAAEVLSDSPRAPEELAAIDACHAFAGGVLRLATVRGSHIFAAATHKEVVAKVHAALSAHIVGVQRLARGSTPIYDTLEPLRSNSGSGSGDSYFGSRDAAALMDVFVTLAWNARVEECCPPTAQQMGAPMRTEVAGRLSRGKLDELRRDFASAADDVTGQATRGRDALKLFLRGFAAHARFPTPAALENALRRLATTLVLRATYGVEEAANAAVFLTFVCSKSWWVDASEAPAMPSGQLLDIVLAKACDMLFVAAPRAADNVALLIRLLMERLVRPWRLQEADFAGSLLRVHVAAGSASSSSSTTPLLRVDMTRRWVSLCASSVAALLEMNSDATDRIALLAKHRLRDVVMGCRVTARIVSAAEDARCARFDGRVPDGHPLRRMRELPLPRGDAVVEDPSLLWLPFDHPDRVRARARERVAEQQRERQQRLDEAERGRHRQQQQHQREQHGRRGGGRGGDRRRSRSRSRSCSRDGGAGGGRASKRRRERTPENRHGARDGHPLPAVDKGSADDARRGRRGGRREEQPQRAGGGDMRRSENVERDRALDRDRAGQRERREREASADRDRQRDDRRRGRRGGDGDGDRTRNRRDREGPSATPDARRRREPSPARQPQSPRSPPPERGANRGAGRDRPNQVERADRQRQQSPAPRAADTERGKQDGGSGGRRGGWHRRR